MLFKRIINKVIPKFRFNSNSNKNSINIIKSKDFSGINIFIFFLFVFFFGIIKDNENEKHKREMTVEEAGRKGVEAVVEKYGPEHMAEIGRKGEERSYGGHNDDEDNNNRRRSSNNKDDNSNSNMGLASADKETRERVSKSWVLENKNKNYNK